MARLLLLSNGHGEDLSGALLGRALSEQGHEVQALPLVGQGNSYRTAGIPLLGRTREFSTGGIGYTSLRGRLTELMQGQLLHLLEQLLRLLRRAHRFDLIVVVGDVIPVIASWLCRRPAATYLVAYSSHYEGRLRLPWPCAELLATPRFLAVFSRDQLTADDLSQQLRRPVRFLGNPFMDPVLTPVPPLPAATQRIGLLPGSRRPELEENLRLLLAVAEQLPVSGELSLDLALVPSLEADALGRLADSAGWQQRGDRLIHRDGATIHVRRDAFQALLQSSDLLICMAGTAAEQAVGLGRPVLQLPGRGPQFTAAFAEAQRRLLGPTVFCANGDAGSLGNLQASAQLALQLLERWRSDQQLQRQCRQEAERRLGAAGGGRRMAAAISALLS
ncbi:hypothetical protein SynA15127_02567 [Synechococcus sp. A15-127]|uniref:lipid-A-disaccharide synthase-related protein n=1 Tax=Synechococcus sp. A15-127 TaxID=1050624 RepID=UPI001646288C|nr:lipid-A-disaccharide synthase-related protein [Synechococcus sp. A15-127]QNI95626.1 hypothetical protein SynA15127_02567 [Synechococcus sp. A15-127]